MAQINVNNLTFVMREVLIIFLKRYPFPLIRTGNWVLSGGTGKEKRPF